MTWSATSVEVTKSLTLTVRVTGVSGFVKLEFTSLPQPGIIDCPARYVVGPQGGGTADVPTPCTGVGVATSQVQVNLQACDTLQCDSASVLLDSKLSDPVVVLAVSVIVVTNEGTWSVLCPLTLSSPENVCVTAQEVAGCDMLTKALWQGVRAWCQVQGVWLTCRTWCQQQQ